MREHAWQHDKYLNHPVMWLREPCFLMVWNIHISCNLSYAMRGIIMRAIVTHGIITLGTGHARDSLEWYTCRHKRAVNIHYIHQQLTYKNVSNSVHNCESCSHMNYQGNGLIAHVIVISQPRV